MGWPPQPGDLLPHAGEALGIRAKLLGYSLKLDHDEGGPKAKGFMVVLGITVEAAAYLEEQIRVGIETTPIVATRANPPYGINCVVEFPIRGIGAQSDRSVTLRTIWLVSDPDVRPGLITALLRP